MVGYSFFNCGPIPEWMGLLGTALCGVYLRFLFSSCNHYPFVSSQPSQQPRLFQTARWTSNSGIKIKAKRILINK